MQKKKYPLQKMIDICRSGHVKHPTTQIIDILAMHGFRANPGFDGAVPLATLAGIKVYLVQDHGIHPDMFRPGAIRLSDMESRADVIGMSANEKTGGQRVRGDLVIVRPQPGRALRMNGADYRLPPHSTLNLLVKDAENLETKGIILVENWEAFRDFEHLNFKVPACWSDYPLVFRGMPGLANPGASKRFLERLKRLVIVFPDFDPAGLVLAMAAPGYTDILWPGEAGLNAMIEAGFGDSNWYYPQLEACRQRLDASEGAIWKAWELMKRRGRAVMQESFLRDQA